MHPAELLEPYGNIDPRRHSTTPGIEWLQRIADHFDRAVWINPETRRYWEIVQTTRIVRRLFPMFHLSGRRDHGSGLRARRRAGLTVPRRALTIGALDR